MLSDEEVLCSFMEPREVLLEQIAKWVAGGEYLIDDYPTPRWWRWTERPEATASPIPITLVECHKIEERLTDEQWTKYRSELFWGLCRRFPGKIGDSTPAHWNQAIHTDAPTRIKALAAVLRKEVEK